MKVIASILLLCAFAAHAAPVINPADTIAVAEGNSRMANGPSIVDSYLCSPSYLNFIFVSLTNVATAGQSSIDFTNQYVTQVQVQTNGSGSHVRLAFYCDNINDNWIANSYADTIYRMSNWLAAAKADGFRTCLITTAAKDGSSGWSNATWRTGWTNIVTWERTNSLTDYVLDAAAIFGPETFGNTNIWNEATPNELHFTPYAKQVLATNLYYVLTLSNFPPASINISGRVSIGGHVYIGPYLPANDANMVFRFDSWHTAVSAGSALTDDSRGGPSFTLADASSFAYITNSTGIINFGAEFISPGTLMQCTNDVFDFSGARTFCFWLKNDVTNEPPGENWLGRWTGDLNESGQWYFGEYFSDIAFVFSVGDGITTVVAPTGLSLTQTEDFTNHIALVYDGGSDMKVYTNGLLASEGFFTASATVTPKFIVGGTIIGGSPSWSWTGKMDEFYGWKRALSSNEVNAIYQLGLQGRQL